MTIPPPSDPSSINDESFPLGWEVTDRYLAGDPSQPPSALDRNPEAVEMLQALQRDIHDALPGTQGIDANRVWQGVHARMGALPMRSLAPGIPRWTASSVWIRRIPLIVAASVLVVLVGIPQIGVLRRGSNQSNNADAPREFTTHAGERATLTLADGSQVMLGPSSNVMVPATFGLADRRISVRGAAYFSVVPQHSTPFIVTLGQTDIRVLGTTFGVQQYAEDHQATIAVQSGRVAVTRVQGDVGGKLVNPVSLVVGANEVVFVASDGTTVLRRDQDLHTLLAWTDGRLEFLDTPLRDVLPQLARWYNVTFQLSDPSINELLLTATFDDESLDDCLRAFSSVLNLRFTKQGRAVTLTRK